MKSKFKIKRHFNKFATYEAVIFIGLIMAVITFLKLMGVIDFSSDWLWFLAGVGLFVEGLISLIKQMKFDNKFMVVKRE